MAENYVDVNRYKVGANQVLLEKDPVAEEEPLLIQLRQQEQTQVFSLTMRTPGEDKELAFGLLFSEGVIKGKNDVESLDYLLDSSKEPKNILEVRLSDKVTLETARFERHLTSYSGCGLCGKTSLQALELKQSRAFKTPDLKLSNQLVKTLKELLAEQPLFSLTGGVHAAGLIYIHDGKLATESAPFFEDVGRHNALDKLIGHELLNNDLAQSGLLVLSGRIGFELVQKAIMAGFSTIIALGAPSHLAIRAANQFDVALIGFAKDNSFNLYTSHRELITT
ncbi:formate dehydrogenase accessory sulfurtransferase FdhD [Aliikangiella marina]|uniref:Sulfur carrier protein FdhD n=1 Tax=Aliikangiella marina TaxID=1712262 RepID=A0A545T4Y3_9GAMM|nr:formate dehydrogenase accessory sulfurtransferase FdhD [Aliikangiella marina]TQV72289.1 formate dehydrogenase accessory sulfurtransferase FdhD [Aliikangiella marina]